MLIQQAEANGHRNLGFEACAWVGLVRKKKGEVEKHSKEGVRLKMCFESSGAYLGEL